MRRGRVSAFGSAYSVIAIVSGSMLAILFAPNSHEERHALGVDHHAVGIRRGVGDVDELDVAGLRIEPADHVGALRVNHSMPF